jgi:release factor glutamine methyltransferase
MDVKSLFKYTLNNLKFVSDSPTLESELLLSYVLGVKREKLYLIRDKNVDDYLSKKLLNFVEKRMEGYPFFYIFREKEFMGINFSIGEGVLIPRPETEILVEESLQIANGKQMNVLDIGTGSGCIISSFLFYNKLSKGIGIDISRAAIEVALLNARKLNLLDRVNFVNIDLLNYHPLKAFDLILSNPPYVKSKKVLNIKYEPRKALDGGEDGFEFYPYLFRKAFSMLADGGFVVVEIDDDMGERSIQIMKDVGFKKTRIIKDLSNLDRFVFGAK